MTDISTTDEKLLFCSFCGKNQNEVKKLIAGPSVYICDECVSLCNDIIKEDLESKEAEIRVAKDTAKRKEVMNELLSPLNKGQREIMADLLESVQTDRLQKSFDKYMPSVIAGDTPAKDTKATLTEGTQVTGNKQTNDIDASTSTPDNVVDIRRLAGLK